MTPRYPEADRYLVEIGHELRVSVLTTAVHNERATLTAMERAEKGARLIDMFFNSRIPTQEAVGAAAMSPEAQDALAFVQDGTKLGDLHRDPTPEEINTSLDAIATDYEDTPTAPVVSINAARSAEQDDARLRADQARRAIERLAEAA